MQEARDEVIKVEGQYQDGAITNGERYNKVIAIWSEVTEKIADEMFGEMEALDKSGRNFNPVYIMADSGARGSKQQIRQLAGMRGLMAKPSGEIIETPITSNFREGLTVLQYFISTHGARKGLADTALKTADSGYLTRRLVDVAQDVIISEIDCGTLDGIEARAIVDSGGEIVERLSDRIIGRVALEAIVDPASGEVIVPAAGEIDETLADAVEDAGIERVKIRSVLTCASRRGVCAKCYGRDLATGRLVELGLAVGVIAAQSIGEPGTQLTMRTFHIGGTASRVAEQSTLETRHKGTVRFDGLLAVEGREQTKDASAGAQVAHRHEPQRLDQHRGRQGRRPRALLGRLRRAPQGARRPARREGPDPRRVGSVHVLDPHRGRRHGPLQGHHRQGDGPRGSGRDHGPVAAHHRRLAGREEAAGDRDRGAGRPGAAQVPHAVERPLDGRATARPCIAGDVLAKIPRETTKTKDITGGLPRVVELFEARKPRETAVISEIDGTVRHGGIVKGLRKILVVPDEGAEAREYSLPRGVHVNVQEGDRVRAGEPLMDGPRNPHDILAVLGEKELQALPGQRDPGGLPAAGRRHQRQAHRGHRPADDAVGEGRGGGRHRVPDRGAGGQVPLPGRERARARRHGGLPAKGRPLLLGITKASLSTDSFISAASFQETTRVLTEASISGKVDYLRGLKENVTMGRLIPAGTGFEWYKHVTIPPDEPPPPPPPSPEELEAQREMDDYADLDFNFKDDE